MSEQRRTEQQASNNFADHARMAKLARQLVAQAGSENHHHDLQQGDEQKVLSGVYRRMHNSSRPHAAAVGYQQNFRKMLRGPRARLRSYDSVIEAAEAIGNPWSGVPAWLMLSS